MILITQVIAQAVSQTALAASEQMTGDEMARVITSLASLGAAFAPWVGAIAGVVIIYLQRTNAREAKEEAKKIAGKVEKVEAKLEETHLAVNSKMDALLKAKEEETKALIIAAEGKGRDDQRDKTGGNGGHSLTGGGVTEESVAKGVAENLDIVDVKKKK